MVQDRAHQIAARVEARQRQQTERQGQPGYGKITGAEERQLSAAQQRAYEDQ